MDFFKIGKNLIKPCYPNTSKGTIHLDLPESKIPFGMETDKYKKIIKVHMDPTSPFYRKIKDIEETIFELPITHAQLLSQFTNDPSSLCFKSNIRESEKYPPLLIIRIPSKTSTYTIEDQEGDLITSYNLKPQQKIKGKIKLSNVWVWGETYGYTIEISNIQICD